MRENPAAEWVGGLKDLAQGAQVIGLDPEGPVSISAVN